MTLHISIDELEVSPLQTRKRNIAEGIEELKQSLESCGQLHPIICRKISDGRYEVVAGSRRFHAARELGWKTIEASISDLTDQQALEVILAENGQRKNIHPLDAAAGMKRMRDTGASYATIAAVIGRSVNHVRRRLFLLRLCQGAMEAFERGVMPTTVAEEIGQLEPVDQMDVVHWYEQGDRTIAQFRRYVSENIQRDLKTCPWKLSDAILDPSAGACSHCPKTSKSQPTLFEDMEGDRCLDGACFENKHRLWYEQEHLRDAELLDISHYSIRHKNVYPSGSFSTKMEGVPASLRRQAIWVNGPKRGHIIDVVVHPDYQKVPVAKTVISSERILGLAQGIGDLVEPGNAMGDAVFALAFKRTGDRGKELLASIDREDIELCSTDEQHDLLLACLLIALRAPEEMLLELAKDYGVRFRLR